MEYSGIPGLITGYSTGMQATKMGILSGFGLTLTARFNYPVFGNANNLLCVGEDDAANEWSGFNNFLPR
jgi:hypothetical protein